MKIGIIGSGQVGQVLAAAFLKEGHSAMLGSRTPDKEAVVQWKANNPGGLTGTFAEAAAFGDLIVLATQGAATQEAIELAGVGHFTGKTVIDATNPIAPGAPVNGVLPFFTTLDDSLMERLQRQLPEAHLVKAFSSVGNHFMYQPDFGGILPTMFICGNDASAKQTVTDILTAFGWETADMGGVEAARAIEPLCILWCLPGFLHNQWMHAFKLLKK
jgi:8-hydroxy-5-deazaflavin:NADPH oxidoreductase